MSNGLERVTRFGDRTFDRLRHPRAFSLNDGDADDADLGPLSRSKYAVLVTFRRNGDPVPSPVWLAVDADGVAYVKTGAHAGKVKRIRGDPRVLVAPSTMRGKPQGKAIRAAARILPPHEWSHAEQVLARAYGGGRRIAERLLGSTGEPAYIELSRSNRAQQARAQTPKSG